MKACVLTVGFFFRNSSIWLGLTKPLNEMEWMPLNDEPINNTITDLRGQSTNWKDEISSILQNSEGCAKLTPSGMIDVSFNESCSESFPALCSYRKCLTTDGEPCIFPFKHKNVTLEGLETELVYKKCSTVGLFVPWCPTGQSLFLGS